MPLTSKGSTTSEKLPTRFKIYWHAEKMLSIPNNHSTPFSMQGKSEIYGNLDQFRDLIFTDLSHGLQDLCPVADPPLTSFN